MVADDSAADRDGDLFVESVLDRAERHVYGDDHSAVESVSGTVAWSGSSGSMTCTESGTSTTTVTAGNPGTTTCTTSSLAAGTDTITANYSGDNIHSASSGSLCQIVNAAGDTVKCRFHFESVRLWPERELHRHGGLDERNRNSHWNRAVQHRWQRLRFAGNVGFGCGQLGHHFKL